MPNNNKANKSRSMRRNRNNSDYINLRRPLNIVGGTSMQTPNIGPTIKVTRRLVEGFDITCDGINPSVGIFNFSLNDLPSSSEFTSLFQLYRLDEVNIKWRPEYTELTDAALVSNAVNVGFNSAVSVIGATPVTVADVLQNSNCSTTSITKEHDVRFRPALLMDGTSPCYCFVSTASPSSNWWGLQYAIPPTGVAMTFSATVVYRISLRGPQ